MSGWVVPIFEDLCESLLVGAVRGDVVARVGVAADFFVDLARHFPTSAAVGPSALREALGAERLRRCEKAVVHLSARLGLAWDSVAEPPGREMTGAGLATDGLGPLQKLASSYDAFLVARLGAGHLAPRTVRAYRRACAGLLTFASTDGRSSPGDRDVRRLLWAKPGLRASLGPFLSWLKAEKAIAVAMPRRAARDVKKAELRLVGDVSRSMAEIETAQPGARHSALLAFLLARLLGIPLEDVLRLRWSDLTFSGSVVLCWNDGDTLLPQRVGMQIARLRGAQAGLVFAGRSGLRPLSTGAVEHHREMPGRPS